MCNPKEGQPSKFRSPIYEERDEIICFILLMTSLSKKLTYYKR